MSSTGGNYSFCDDWTTMEGEGMGPKAETPTDGFVRLNIPIQLFMTGREV